MNEIRPQRKCYTMGLGTGWITNTSFFIFRCTVQRREGARTLVKNSSHWRYETQFIHRSSAQTHKRLTAEWFATSVNLPKWGRSQICAAASALNNSQHCTSVLSHFNLFSSLSTVRSPNHCNSIMRHFWVFFPFFFSQKNKCSWGSAFGGSGTAKKQWD